jgi:hypothetical protein
MKKNIFNSRFQIPLYITPFVLFIIVVLLVSVHYYGHVRRSLIDDVLTLYQEPMRNIQHGYSNLSKNLILSSEILANSPYIKRALTGRRDSVGTAIPSLRTDLELVEREFDEEISLFQLYDPEKRLLLSVPDEKESGRITTGFVDKTLSRAADSRLPVVDFFEDFRNKEKKSHYLIYVTPAHAGHNKSEGFLLFLVDLDAVNRNLLSDMSSDLKLVDEPQIFVISGEGRIVYQTGGDLVKMNEPVPLLPENVHMSPLVRGESYRSKEVRIAEKEHFYYLSAPASFSIKYRNSIIAGPSFSLLFILSKSIFHRQLSVSVISIVLASILLVLLLIIPGIFVFRTLYTLERKRTRAFERELKMAYDIQMNFLPKESIEIPGFDVFCVSRPARQVGGDFFNLIPITGSTFCIVVGDASGKGVPGALLMMLGTTLTEVLVHEAGKPAQVLSRMNRFIEKASEAGMFITMLFGLLDIKRRTLVYLTAGHSPPILFRNGKVNELEGGLGPVLGCFSEAQFKEEEINLLKGDIIVFYTDGCTDVWNEKKDRIEEEKLWSSITLLENPSARKVAEHIMQSLEEFQGRQEQFDDRTLAIIKVNE